MKNEMKEKNSSQNHQKKKEKENFKKLTFDKNPHQINDHLIIIN